MASFIEEESVPLAGVWVLFKFVVDSVEPALLGGAGGILLELGNGLEAIEGEDLGFVSDVVVEDKVPLPFLERREK